MDISRGVELRYAGGWDSEFLPKARKFLDELPIALQAMSGECTAVVSSRGDPLGGLDLKLDNFVEVQGLENIDPQKYWVEYNPIPINFECPNLIIRDKLGKVYLVISSDSK
ncbi:MAG: hypothetical protein NTW17_03560 [Candidatus Pacearchaeota archaeon]|nr:hypothetical protein [Candidatus Pacearchaeota archaeon]